MGACCGGWSFCCEACIGRAASAACTRAPTCRAQHPPGCALPLPSTTPPQAINQQLTAQPQAIQVGVEEGTRRGCCRQLFLATFLRPPAPTTTLLPPCPPPPAPHAQPAVQTLGAVQTAGVQTVTTDVCSQLATLVLNALRAGDITTASRLISTVYIQGGCSGCWVVGARDGGCWVPRVRAGASQLSPTCLPAHRCPPSTPPTSITLTARLVRGCRH